MKKTLPNTMFTDPERSRLSMLRTWVLEHHVTEIEMNERQFWNFAHLQPIAEKPWVTFMGRTICVPDMPVEAQMHLGIPISAARDALEGGQPATGPQKSVAASS